MESVVSARGLSKRYGKTVALDGMSFDIPVGRIVGFIGPNGAGKTTALKAILGLTHYQGELQVLGLDPMRQRNELMRRVSFIADVAVLPKWLKVRHALDFVENIHPGFSRERAERFLAQTEVQMDKRVKQLSKGMVAQLHLSLIMAIDARLLVLDEPTLGLDILFRKEFYTNLLNDYFDEERTIVVTTHQVEEIEHILTDLIFIQQGQVVLNASMDEVQERFAELMVGEEAIEEARTLGPISERRVFGKHVLLYDGADTSRLSQLGELNHPSVADLFVATMRRRGAGGAHAEAAA